jgi:V-type H+-transporting ATPase subunit C
MAAKVDEELKKLSALYNEKNLYLSGLQRKKTVNLATSDFEDFLKPAQVAKLELLNTETLLTVMVVVPSAIENEFIKTYESIGDEIAAYGGPDWTNSLPGRNDGNFGPAVPRASKKGSPVVPGSHIRVCQEGESVLYSVVVLRGQYEAGRFEGDTFVPGNSVDYIEPLKAAFREKRFVLREFSYDAAKSGGLDGQIAAGTAEVRS